MPAPYFEPHVGHMVTPTVRLVRPLGQGGMGSVWIADHLALRTKVAVKFMSSTLALDETFRGRFTREAGAAAQVKSPHVVQVLDHGVGEGELPFIIMELLEGESLAARLAVPPKLQPAEVCAIVGQVCKALTRAHERGIIHRDIKPDNVFLCDADGDVFVKVLDFGVAKDVDTLGATTASGSLVGTPVYMSPEQILGKRDIDGRADLWALGVMTYEMLTGKRPFTGDTVGALAIAIHQRDFERPTALAPNLTPAIDEWFEKACHRDRELRFRTPRELAESLEQALGLKSLVDRSGPIRVERHELPSYVVQSDVLAATVASQPGEPGRQAAQGPVASEAGAAGPATLGGASVHSAPRAGRPRWWHFAVAGVVLGAVAVGVVALRDPPSTPRSATASTAEVPAPSAPPSASVVPPSANSSPPAAAPSVSTTPSAPIAKASASTTLPGAPTGAIVKPGGPKTTAQPAPAASSGKPKKPDYDDIQ